MESPSVVADKESFSAADTAMLERLHAKKAEWVSLSFKEKEALLERMLTRFRAINLRQWCDEAVTVQGYDTASYVGEVTSAIEGIANVGAITNRLTGLIRTYRSLAKSGVPPPLKSTSRPDGRLVARVFPFDADDKKGQTGGAGVTAEVWSAEGGELQRLPGTQPGLCLVLGAGNQSFLSLCDALYWLFVEGMVVVLKHHPIRGFNKVIFDSVCEELLERGYFASTLDLGLPHASWLTSHVLVDQVHMTGGVRTHDAIVWGASPAEQAANKAAGTPVLTKPMSSELGCVTPWAICPGGGEWSTAQIEHHAGVLTLPFISQSSCNCCAPKVVVLDRDWPYAKQHYPGMAERYERFRAAYPQRDEVTSFECPTGAQYRGPPPLPWMLIELDPAGSNDYALQNEAFGPVLAFVYLPGGNRPDAFLREMVTFTHSRLWGALSATLVVRDEVLAEEPAAVEAAIADLRYGIVCLNTWSAMSFELGATTWGGYPGETLDTVASGIGVTGNCMLIRKPEKTVLRAPFQHAAQLKLFPDGTTALSAAQLRAVATFTHVPSSWNLTKLIFRMVTGSKPKPPTVASPSHTPTVAGSPSPSPPPPSPVCGTAFGVGSTSPATPRRGVLRSRGAYMGFFAPRFFVLDGHELRWWGKGRVIGVVASRAEPTPDGPPRGLMRLTGARVTGTEGPTGSKGGERCILIVPAADVAARGEPSSLPAAERTFTMVLAAPSEVEHVSWLRELQRAAAGA